MKKRDKVITHRKFSWIIFFIILVSTASVCLLFIPYPETKVIESGIHAGLSSDNPYTIRPVEFPWRSHSQEIFLNVTVTEGNISLQIIDTNAGMDFLSGRPYVPYWEIINTTGFTANIQISPPAKGLRHILIYAEDDAWFFIREIKISYLNYASSYGFFFLGVAVILISFYGYRRYKWRSYL